MRSFISKSPVSISGFLLLFYHAASLAQPDGAAGATAAADGVAGASGYVEPTGPEMYNTEYEAELLTGTYQLITGSLRSGEGYFSADGELFIFQSEVPGLSLIHI